MPFVIQRHSDGDSRRDGGFVTRPGSEHSYSKSIRQARVWKKREDAEAHRCENESVVPLSEFVDLDGGS